MSGIKSISSIAGALALALSSGLAQAQSYGSDITVEAARKVAARTVAECQKNNWRLADEQCAKAGASAL